MCTKPNHTLVVDVSVTHYCDFIMDAMASQITSLTTVYSIVDSGADQRKHQSSASPAFVRGIHRGPVNSPHKWPVTRKMFPFDDVIMKNGVMPWKRVQLLAKYFQSTYHSSPVRTRYRVSFVGLKSDSCLASVTAVLYAISYHIWPCYNGTNCPITNKLICKLRVRLNSMVNARKT